MSATQDKTKTSYHRNWIQQLQPVGLVVSPHALEELEFYIDKQISEQRELLKELLTVEEVSVEREGRNIVRLPKERHERFFMELLGWSHPELSFLSGSKLGGQRHLSYKLPEYDTPLRPTYALYQVPEDKNEGSVDDLDFDLDFDLDEEADDSPPSTQYISYKDLQPKLLVSYVTKPLDEKMSLKGEWDETHQNRLERLLRELKVPLGLLMNEESLRVVYAPVGESSGYMTFEFEHILEPSGRDLLSALLMLLSAPKLLDSDKSLHKVLIKSRKHQNTVSTQLSKQVLDSFWALLRGFEAAYNQRGEGEARQTFNLLAQEEPEELYEGVLTVIMRLLFLIYAEEEGLVQGGALYEEAYSVTGLFQRLEADRAIYQEAMEERRGAWAQLLSLTRMIFEGCTYQSFKLPSRLGELFNPDRFAFLEGRAEGSSYQDEAHAVINTPPLSDACLHRVLSNLLVLNGERLSYRALGVEEIGSVYESMMGYEVERATGPSVALKPYDVVISLDELLAEKDTDRKKWVETNALLKMGTNKTDKEVAKKLKEATDIKALFEALKPKLSPRSGVMLVEGSLYLQPGEERRKTGSHYTPRSLSAPVVARALEPHLDKVWATQDKSKRPEKILSLKVCDPAMGSGAFLVETCRQLADALVEAWRQAGVLAQEAGQEEALLKARRAVAQRCLYGVDKNPYAVSLAKLSLWLFTLSKDESFTFLDHNLRCGDSLVGVGNEELAKLQWVLDESSMQAELDFTQNSITQAVQKRLALLQDTNQSYEALAEAYEQAQEATAELKVIADALIATFFMFGTMKEREIARGKLETLVRAWFDAESDSNQRKDTFACIYWVANSLLNLKHPVSTFHWGLEFPEVFGEGGFHCFVGNPPFMGKNTLINSSPDFYVDWLKLIHEKSHGNSDVAAHFFRRTYQALRPKGTLGLVSTNTISQGDTKKTGLEYLCSTSNGYIFDAIKRKVWPGNAAVIVSTIHLSRNEIQPVCKLDGREVPSISAFLATGTQHNNPLTLKSNAGKSFVGSYILGMGFTFSDTDKSTPYNQLGATGVGTPSLISDIEELQKRDPRNGDLIFPYIGGSELNSHPEHKPHRYVINFGERSLAEASQWPDLLGIVERKVKPERDKNKREVRRKYWWRFGEVAPALYQAIKGMDRVLFNSQVSTHMTFAFLPTNYVYASYGYVYPLQTNAAFCALQNRLHEVWALTFASSLEDRLRYTPTDCFETFPFPKDYDSNPNLESAGQAYYEFRAKFMADAEFRAEQGMIHDPEPEGMTKTYNHFHNPDCAYPGIKRLRALHAEMDRAVADAYGWEDLELEYDWVDHYSGLLLKDRLEELAEDDEVEPKDYGKHYKARYTFTPEVKDEVMGRLLALNAERAEEEANPKKAKKSKPAPSETAPKPNALAREKEKKMDGLL